MKMKKPGHRYGFMQYVTAVIVVYECIFFTLALHAGRTYLPSFPEFWFGLVAGVVLTLTIASREGFLRSF
jgi:hypothetical protein